MVPWIRPATVLALALLAQAASAQEAPVLTDAEIAHVAVTANAIDAELAELAPSRARSDQVLNFARTMVNDHTAVNERAAALAARLKLTPADNDVSRSLRDGAETARARLSGLEGADFDLAYMEREVAYHQAVLDALDQVLLPQTGNGELKELLEAARAAVAVHLDHARSLAAELSQQR